MCFDLDSRPPIDSTPQPGVDAEHHVLTGADDNQLLAYSAAPAEDGACGIVILPDVRGICPFYQAIAIDLANHGYRATVIDYYGRTAGTEPRTPTFEPTPHAMQTTTVGTQSDIHSAIAHLHSRGVDSVATLGFCFGGRHAFLTSAPEFQLAGTVGFYGMPGTGGPLGPGPTQKAEHLAAPILGIFGGADEYIPRSEVDAFDQALTVNGIEHDIHVYDAAPHSFFDIKHNEHHQASVDAWRTTHRFLDRIFGATGHR
jgi:carboxymethylenebutenolidase